MVRRGVSGAGPKVEPVLVAIAVAVVAGIGVGSEAEDVVETEVDIHGRKGLVLVEWRKRQARPEPR